jgi:hypothetical protein
LQDRGPIANALRRPSPAPLDSRNYSELNADIFLWS